MFIYQRIGLAFLAYILNVLAAVDFWLMVVCCHITVRVLQLQSGARKGICARPCVSHAAHTSSVPEVAESECCLLRLVCADRCLAEQYAVQERAHLSEERQCRVSALQVHPTRCFTSTPYQPCLQVLQCSCPYACDRPCPHNTCMQVLVVSV